MALSASRPCPLNAVNHPEPEVHQFPQGPLRPVRGRYQKQG
jgi:hypothetical protein